MIGPWLWVRISLLPLKAKDNIKTKKAKQFSCLYLDTIWRWKLICRKDKLGILLMTGLEWEGLFLWLDLELLKLTRWFRKLFGNIKNNRVTRMVFEYSTKSNHLVYQIPHSNHLDDVRTFYCKREIFHQPCWNWPKSP